MASSPSLMPLPGCRKRVSLSQQPASLCRSQAAAARKRLCRRSAAGSPGLFLAADLVADLVAMGRDYDIPIALDYDNCAWLYGAAVPERREGGEQPRVLAVLHEAARDILLRSLARLTC